MLHGALVVFAVGVCRREFDRAFLARLHFEQDVFQGLHDLTSAKDYLVRSALTVVKDLAVGKAAAIQEARGLSLLRHMTAPFVEHWQDRDK